MSLDRQPAIARIYYARQLPPRAVAIARVKVPLARPSDLVDIISTPYLRQPLTVETPAGTLDAVIPGRSLAISGATIYRVGCQYVELTTITTETQVPLYYRHRLPGRVSKLQIEDPDGNKVDTDLRIIEPFLYHNLGDGTYFAVYYHHHQKHRELLRAEPVVRRASWNKTLREDEYALSPSGQLKVGSTRTYYLRFRRYGGYEVLPPHDTLPNDPWYLRISFSLAAFPREWARQPFFPFRPYQLAVWAPGRVVDSHTVRFDRAPIYYDGTRYPDLLVFDSSFKLRHAIDGTPAGVRDKGYIWPWEKNQILDFEPYQGQLRIGPELRPDDLVFGFFAYDEPDIVYREIDINPHTNPLVRNRVIEIYYKEQPSIDPFRNIYYRLYDPDRPAITIATNDPNPQDPAGERPDEYVFGTVTVGFSVGLEEVQIEDIRQPGGGLRQDLHYRVEGCEHLWDLGFWDGKPYPIEGSYIIYIPEGTPPPPYFSEEYLRRLLLSFGTSGTVPVIKYYNEAGEEL